MVALSKFTSRIPVESDSDRRMFPRKELHVRVEGRRMDHTLDARQCPHLNLALQDLSLGGLAALCDRPLAKGEHLSVSFPPNGTHHGWDAYGRVLRCEPSHFGYRLAVEFDSLPAA